MGLALIKPFFKRVWENPQLALVKVPGLREGTEITLMTQLVDEIEERQPYLEEIPLLDGEGRITRVLVKSPSPQVIESSNYRWHALEFMSSKVNELDKIYISSLEHPDILDFYRVWKGRLPLEILNANNISKALAGENTLLIYGADVYPDCPKIGIEMFWYSCVEHWIEKKVSWTLLKTDFASITKSQLNRLDCQIRLFDQGYQSIAVMDENGIYESTLIPSTFLADFPSRHFRSWGNLFVPYQGDSEQVKKRVLAMCFGTARREVPLVANGRVIGVGKLCATNVEGLMKQEPFFPPLHWEIISPRTVETFFGKHRKVLISSEFGDLYGFSKRFADYLDITIFEDAVLDKYLAGEFDVLICGANVWPGNYTLKYTARELYADMLSWEIANYLQAHRVDYWYLSLARPALNGAVRRGKGTRTESWPSWELADSPLGYYKHEDGEFFHEGRRLTLGGPANYSRSVFFYGPCTAEGALVNSQDTIESLLQEHLNRDKRAIRVLNCGCAGPEYDINCLHRIMDAEYHEGDTIVQIGRQLTKKSMLAMTGRMLHTDDIFDLHSAQKEKVYIDDSSSHFTVDGNKMVADYLYGHMNEKLFKTPKSRRSVPSFCKAREL